MVDDTWAATVVVHYRRTVCPITWMAFAMAAPNNSPYSTCSFVHRSLRSPFWTDSLRIGFTSNLGKKQRKQKSKSNWSCNGTCCRRMTFTQQHPFRVYCPTNWFNRKRNHFLFFLSLSLLTLCSFLFLLRSFASAENLLQMEITNAIPSAIKQQQYYFNWDEGRWKTANRVHTHTQSPIWLRITCTTIQYA